MEIERVELIHREVNGNKKSYYRWLCSCGATCPKEADRCRKCGTDRFTFIEELAKGRRITPKLKREMMGL